MPQIEAFQRRIPRARGARVPDTDHYIFRSRFPAWRTTPTTLVSNKPSPGTIAFWNTATTSRNITFDQPVAAVSFFYASRVNVTLTAYDASRTTFASDVFPPNALPAFDTSDQGTIGVQQNDITRVRRQGQENLTAIDDFESCQIVVIDVDIDIKPGSPPE